MSIVVDHSLERSAQGSMSTVMDLRDTLRDAGLAAGASCKTEAEVAQCPQATQA